MKRLAFILTLGGVAGLVIAALSGLPSVARAFEVDTGAATVPGGTARFNDPDETPLPAPLSTPQLQEDGTAAMAPVIGRGGNSANDGTLIPAPSGNAPFWTYSGAPAQRMR
jgi:hypothetical protein